MEEAVFSIIEGQSAETPILKFFTRVIRAGKSMNGNIYPEAVLRESAPLFEGVRVFARSDDEHTGQKPDDVRNLVGVLKNARWWDGYVVAEMHCLPSHEMTRRIEEAVRNQMPIYGVSIDATAYQDSKKVVTRFEKINHLDIVANPSAGGEITSILEAKNMSEENQIAADDPEVSIRNLTETNQKLLKQVAELQFRSGLADVMSAYEFPPGVADHVKNLFKISPPTSVEAAKNVVECVLKQFANYAINTDAGKVKVPAGSVVVVESEREKHMAMWKKFFEGDITISLREAYSITTGDTKFTGKPGRITEGVMSTTDFPELLGTVMRSRMVDLFTRQVSSQGLEFISVESSLDDFEPYETYAIGGLGHDLPEVAEGAAYQTGGEPSTVSTMYRAKKYGELAIGITIEMIKGNRASIVQQIPNMVANKAASSLCRRAFGFLIDNPSITYRVNNIPVTNPVFCSAHGNIGAIPMTNQGIKDLWVAMGAQEIRGTGESLMLRPAHLFVPFSLYPEARELVSLRGQANEASFAANEGLTVHQVSYFTSDSTWYAITPKEIRPFLQIGYVGGERLPEILVSDIPNAGSYFTNDTILYRVKHSYGITVNPDGWQAAFKCN